MPVTGPDEPDASSGVPAGGHRLLRRAETGTAGSEPATPTFTAVGTPATTDAPPVAVAVGAHDRAASVVDTAARLARDTGSPLEVVHVRQTTVVEDQAVDTETDAEVSRAVTAHPERLTGLGAAATGQVLTSVGDHAAAGRSPARHAAEVRARTVAAGRSPPPSPSSPTAASPARSPTPPAAPSSSSTRTTPPFPSPPPHCPDCVPRRAEAVRLSAG
jgi:hypothetical protein